MSGGAPAADSSNNLSHYGEWDLRRDKHVGSDQRLWRLIPQLTGGLSVSQYFTPSSPSLLHANDQDFGAGGAAILVDQLSGPVPHLVIGGGKDGYLYF